MLTLPKKVLKIVTAEVSIMSNSLNVNSINGKEDGQEFEVNIKRLGQQQKDVLRFMYNGFVCQQKDIIQSLYGQVTNSRKASVSRTVKNLREKSLIKEIDKKRTHYSITEKGKYFVETDTRFNIRVNTDNIPKETTDIGLSSLSLDNLHPRCNTHLDSDFVDSIEDHGIIQELIVRQKPGKEGYQIIDGSRRYRAAMKAQIRQVPCTILYGVNDTKAVSISLELNTYRQSIDENENKSDFN